MRLGQVVFVLALVAPGAAAAATFAIGQAAVIRIDGDGLACAGTVPVTLSTDGADRVQLVVGDVQRCTEFPASWDGCTFGQGYRILCRDPGSQLVLDFEDELRVDVFVSNPARPAWHHLEGTLQTVG